MDTVKGRRRIESLPSAACAQRVAEASGADR
jgi:hypothetical protein